MAEINAGCGKKFSVGWFDDAYLRECEIATVETADGYITAFANVLSVYQIKEITIDLMRHRPNVEPGTMDFLFISMFQHFQQRGYDSFNLGLSALSGVGGTPDFPRLGEYYTIFTNT